MVRRSNGFQKPFNPMQIGTWFLLPVLLLQFLLFATPILPLAASIPCTVIVFLCGVFTTYFAYKCCVIDPIDERLRRHLANESGGTYGISSNNSPAHGIHAEQEAGPTKFCWVCGIDVHEISMHCKFCDKCVARFDHHCHWLNTCVGESNYEYFFRTVGSTLALVLMHGGVLAGLVVSFFIQYAAHKRSGSEFDTDDTSTLKRSNDWFGLDAGIAVAVVNTVFLVIDIACISLLGQLFLFHIRLRREKLTTYAYIVRDGQRKREAVREKMQIGRKRITAIADAKKEGKLIRICFLKAAGCPFVGEFICKPCDPLRLDEMKSKAEKQKEQTNIPSMSGEMNLQEAEKDVQYEQEDQSNTVELGECPPSRCNFLDEQKSGSDEEVVHDVDNNDALKIAMEQRKDLLREKSADKQVEFISVASTKT
jgi:palmitoyltransferase